jgi:electron-transferring-flavoprotein dehydrogenase
MLHPYLWRHLKGAKLRSWGAKSLQESGIRGEPQLVGDGFARIGEGSGSTNVLVNSGVDEAWATGVQLAEAVIELAAAGKPFDRANLEQAYVQRRRASWVEHDGRVAERARDGFQRGIVPGMLGMMLAGLSKGKLALPGRPLRPHERVGAVEKYYEGRISADEIERLRRECDARGVGLHDALMTRAGWPEIPFDGELLVSQQDALLLGGKVQAAPGFADHVTFALPGECETCGSRICIEMCSGQAIAPGPDGRPVFDREKCVHCGACLWNCEQPHPDDPERSRVVFTAGAGGFHSAEN